MTGKKPEIRGKGISEEIFRSVFDNSPIGNCLVSLDGRFLRVNSAFCHMLGYSENELQSMTFGEVTHPDDLSASNEWVHNLLSGKSTLPDLEKRYLHKTGKVVWGIARPFLLRDAGGQPLFFSTSIQDISERKQAENALHESEIKYRNLVNTVYDLIWSVDAQGRITFINKSSKRIYDYEPEELIGRSFLDLLVPEERTRQSKYFQEMLASRDERLLLGIETEVQDRFGNRHTLMAKAVMMYDQEGNVIGSMGTATDITERKKTEETLKETEERFRILLEQGFDGIFIHRDLIILDMNQRLEDITGYSRSELFHSKVINLFTPDSQKRIHNYIISGNEGYYEVELLRKNGRIVNIEAFGATCKFQGHDARIVAIRDITEQKKLQEQLRQAQKMESIGHLAGGIAHDFNNILSAIVGYAHLTLLKLKENDPVRMNIEHILAASDKAANLTQSLLAFSRKQLIVPRPVSINSIIFNMKKILDRIIGEDIDFKVIYNAVNDLIVKVDKGQIEHVLMNLATNARDAMPDGGSLTITTEEVDIDEKFIHMHQEGRIGKYAVITISDTGTGMDENTKGNIFEPFFTTKEVGKGTGLGLAMVYGTIKQHNGFINVYSEPGKGTNLKIYLPLAESGVQHKEKEEVTSVSSGNETVLLIEDDQAVRRSIKALLEEFGYKVIEAADGDQAITLFRKNKDFMQLVISDVIMPRQSGKEVYDELKKMKPDIKVLFISGYSKDILTKKGITGEGINFISKPIHPEVFFRKIREVLDK